MKWYLNRVFPALPLLAILAHAVPIEKLKGEAFSDIGQIVKGIEPESNKPEDGGYLSRTGVFISVTDTIQQKLRMSVGVGGLFWQPFPTAANMFWKNYMQFVPTITEASTEFRFSEALSLEGGYFPFKYNHPAMNLGEYLLRSESYPTNLTTGGWTWVDSAYIRVFGARLKASHFDGAFSHEAGVYFELENAPLYDVTPAYLFAWRPIKGIELGGSVALRRWFTNNLLVKNRKAEVDLAKQYVEVANFPEVQNQGMVNYSYDNGGVRVQDSAKAAWRPGTDPATLFQDKAGVQVNSVRLTQEGSVKGMRKGIRQFLKNTTACDANGKNCTPYFNENGYLLVTDDNGALVPMDSVAPQFTKFQEITRQAVNVVAHANIGFGEMLGLEELTGPFGLYGEVAILGVKNQPIFYENVFNRMPVMVGAYLPTFGLFDKLSVEAEYLGNPYQESVLSLGGASNGPIYGGNLPIPDFKNSDYVKAIMPTPSIHGDDLKWSVHAIRTLVPGLQAKVQIANDHLRLHNYDAMAAITPITVERNAWYYLFHLQWNL
ncbi:MAG: hypothetical protein ABIW76_06260 [Fibrobacteria bacterium]